MHHYRTTPQHTINFDGLFIDSFAGGGGASTGAEQAIGRPVDIAINHCPQAIKMHTTNHPDTHHYCEDVWQVDPIKATGGQTVNGMWLSPDCTHHSKARGGKPTSSRVRGLAWVGTKWAASVRPKVIYLENVEEFKDWGPLNKIGKPNKLRKGKTFEHFVKQLETAGYQVEHKILRACDYGAPTIRKRLYLIARCDGQPIAWPSPTHGEGLKPYVPASKIIDWTLPSQSIFERARPLADNTLRRIAKGIEKYIINQKPFIKNGAAHFLTEHANGSSHRVFNINEPLRTQCAQVKGGHFAMASIALEKHTGQQATTKHKEGIAAFLIKYYGPSTGQPLNEPLQTITSKDRFGLITIHSQDYKITDIQLRMLSPRELYNAQGFPKDYVIEVDSEGNKITRAQQIAKCGNSVCPPVARAIIAANHPQQNTHAIAA